MRKFHLFRFATSTCSFIFNTPLLRVVALTKNKYITATMAPRNPEDDELSPSAFQFYHTIDELLAQGKITRNAHALLRHWAAEKEAMYYDYFDLVLIPVHEDRFRIDDLPGIIDSKMNEELKAIYGKVCSHQEARQASVEYRLKNELFGHSFVFGEVEFSSFSSVLNALDLKPGGIFIDLGSATGRAVLTARLAHDFNNCIGLEFIPNLHDLAVSAKKVYQNGKLKLPYPKVEFMQGDLATFEWGFASVVFAHSTCFDDDLLHEMNVKAKDLKPGAYYIVCSLWDEGSDLEEYFTLDQTLNYRMTWGNASIYIFRRNDKSDDDWSF